MDMYAVTVTVVPTTVVLCSVEVTALSDEKIGMFTIFTPTNPAVSVMPVANVCLLVEGRLVVETRLTSHSFLLASAWVLTAA